MAILGLPDSALSKYPPHFDIEKIIRPNILALHPYRCARDDYSEGVLLDANENSLGHSILNPGADQELQSTLDLNLHRYPDPSHDDIKARIATLRSVAGVDHVFLGVGSDEIIDMLMRVCVAPGGTEKILITPPTYGMYSVCAQVNDVGIVKVPLELEAVDGVEGGERGRFSVRVDEVKKAIDQDPSIKLIFLCSPGNPTGTSISLSSVRQILDYEKFKGIVIVDEAYVDFMDEGSSAVPLIKEYGNLCVMQTLSKGFGLASIRLGIALAQPALIQVLMNTKAPYNISTPTANVALAALSPPAIESMKGRARTLIDSRAALLSSLSSPPFSSLGLGRAIGGNSANFVLVPILDKAGEKPDNQRSQKIYKVLAEEKGVVVRYRGGEPGCTGCVRITIGTEEENKVLLEKLEEALRQF